MKKKWMIILLTVLVLFSFVEFLRLTQINVYKSDMMSMDGMFPAHAEPCFKQVFTPEKGRFVGFSLHFDTLGESCNDRILVSLKRDGEPIREWKVNAEDLEPGKETDFLLPRFLPDAYKSEWEIEVNIELGIMNRHVSTCVTTENNHGMKNLETGTETKEGVYLQIRMLRTKFPWQAAFIPTFILGLIFFFIIKRKMWMLKPEMAFLWIIVFFGVFYFAFIPMLQVPDETGHYYRSFEIAQGDFLTPKLESHGVSIVPIGTIPESMTDPGVINYNTVKEAWKEKLDWNLKYFYSNVTQALYSPFNYLPQSIGCFLGKLLSDRTVFIFYMGRFVNYIFCTFLTWLAIKKIPLGKWFLVFLAGMPMSIQQMVSLSTDGFLNAWAFLLIALVLKLITDKEPATRKELVLLMTACFFTALCKVVYLPLCFLVLLVPKERFENPGKRGALFFKSGICLGSTILNLGWFYIACGYLIEFRPGVNTAEQVRFVLTKPWMYLLVLGRTLIERGPYLAGTFVGAKMCMLNVNVNLLFIALYPPILLGELIFADAQEREKLPIRRKWWGLIFFLLIFLLTLTGLYVQWTGVYNPIIEGAQGRYLIPIIPLFLMFLKNRKLKTGETMVRRIGFPAMATVHVVTLFTIFMYFI